MQKKKFKYNSQNFPIPRLVQYTLFVILLLLNPSSNKYFPKSQAVIVNEPTPTITLPPPPPLPVNSTNVQAPLLTAESIVVKDIDSGMTLYAKNENKLLFPASTTKVMTALVILDEYGLDDIVTVKTVINNGRRMNLVMGEKLTVEALLYGTLVHSANDAAYTLAENYPGGVDAFVMQMNNKAQSLGLNNTHFTNPVGFDDPSHYTSASDLTRLAVFALKNKIIDKIVSTKSITVSDISYTYFHELQNVNQLLGKVAGIAGLKTGYTENAGEVLISKLKKNDQTILIVVLKSADRFAETVALIDWVFNNFQWLPLSQITPSEL
ncbi:hypothetical protein A3D78_01840 [Candidatus Gottesmanbacteria bacterium RIFCSPHIGHO2_02_FULL_39_14]|uniref:Peptidase S11 D-alanyl-D-alanine carboxypeptidase A N-terminal domain-containing protein n=1 Tax=Candidatus Gottesmanbacteria bacterium RIFCSPHIGHO2_02_FULL_39_14 TaxID=1798383 RepID=A0A1F6A1J3_9BACT|nr:MAG: hypothetical protein A3D78_01840 [Candidatus Gottesmanbacteria bacterium RIFCSPHIGHO2_02_FULL_39_14]